MPKDVAGGGDEVTHDEGLDRQVDAEKGAGAPQLERVA